MLKDALTPQARHHFTRFDQVDQLVGASEANADLGFMARLLALCSLPRTNPGNRIRYKRANGPYTLYMTAGGDNKLPYGNLPRLILAWVSTEAVQTRSRVLILGSSLSKFMRKLGMEDRSGSLRGDRTRLRNQMDRLFHSHVQLIYEDENHKASVSSQVADRTDLWWNPKRPDEPSLWDSKILLSEAFFNEIISHPVPLDMNTLKALKRCAFGPRPLPVAHLPDLRVDSPATDHLEAVVPPVRLVSDQIQRQANRKKLPAQRAPRVEEDQSGLAGPELRDGTRHVDPLALDSIHPTASTAAFACGIALKACFLAQISPLAALRAPFGS